MQTQICRGPDGPSCDSDVPRLSGDILTWWSENWDQGLPWRNDAGSDGAALVEGLLQGMDRKLVAAHYSTIGRLEFHELSDAADDSREDVIEMLCESFSMFNSPRQKARAVVEIAQAVTSNPEAPDFDRYDIGPRARMMLKHLFSIETPRVLEEVPIGMMVHPGVPARYAIVSAVDDICSAVCGRTKCPSCPLGKICKLWWRE